MDNAVINLQQRVEAELELLKSIYPERVAFDQRSRELRYDHGEARLTLRLPDQYLADERPIVLASRIRETDVRDKVMENIDGAPIGEEILDALILYFDDLCSSLAEDVDEAVGREESAAVFDTPNATIVVWLHHLLNVNKRKQTTTPPSATVSGVTKPGYPGVLVFSGPATAVHEHVNGLKQLKWQVFQVRLESSEEWKFAHGGGVVEVEAMKDIVAEIGEARREVFLEAMRIK